MKPKKKNEPRNLPARKIHFGNEEIWYWSLGKGGAVIMCPSGKRFKISLNILTNWDWQTIERGAHKGYAPAVGPSLIKMWIETRLRHTDGTCVDSPVLNAPIEYTAESLSRRLRGQTK